jgi:hypothetical protein
MIVVSIVFGLFNGLNMFAFMGAEVSLPAMFCCFQMSTDFGALSVSHLGD